MASQGDPRVLALMNVVLSVAFSAVIVRGLSFVGVIEFTWRTVALAAVVLVVLTYLIAIR